MQLVEKEISDSGARMGRPPLGSLAKDTKPTLVRFEAETLAAIDAVAGPNKRAIFIREAVERELERRSKAS
jgi:hypothetical protein